ncbi:MAG: adenylyltransferase/cytidyltransferase family protein [Sphingobacteriia bacterium]|nr:adenylyltransferase/cytidyltransferase family protein [Sphingobacteriia bacterium]
MYVYDYVIYIGRFQPFHKGHFYVVEKALKKAQKILIICGSANINFTTKNPFTFEDRKLIIEKNLKDKYPHRYTVLPLIDTPTDEEWEQELYKIVENYIKSEAISNPKLALIGHKKDDSCYYLDMFKNWDYIEVPNYKGINATDIREKISSHDDEDHEWMNDLTEETLKVLEKLKSHKEYNKFIKF